MMEKNYATKHAVDPQFTMFALVFVFVCECIAIFFTSVLILPVSVF